LFWSFVSASNAVWACAAATPSSPNFVRCVVTIVQQGDRSDQEEN